MKLLRIEHFEAWLEGQIIFGIDIDKEGDYLGRYLAQQASYRRSEPLRYLMQQVGVSCTPRELMEWTRILKREAVA